MNKLHSTLLAIIIFTTNSFSQDQWTTFNTTNTGSNGFIGGYTYAFLQDNNDNLWIGTHCGISVYNGVDWKSFTINDGLKVNEVETIKQDLDNNIWISYGSYLSGVSKFDGNSWIHYDETDGLIYDKVEDIFIDKSGNVWFATYEGISMFNGDTWSNFGQAEGLPDQHINCIIQDAEDNIWAGTNGAGTYKLNNGIFSAFSWPAGSDANIKDMTIDNNGKIWIVTFSGIYTYDGNLWDLVNLTDNGVYASFKRVTSDNENNLYFLSDDGLRVLKNTNVSFFPFEETTPIENFLSCYFANNKLYIGTSDCYIEFYNDTFHYINTKDGGLINNEVNYCIEDTENNQWYCTDYGISKFDGSTWQSFTHIDDGTELRWVQRGLEDSNGAIWFCSVNGIFKYENHSWSHYNTSNLPFSLSWPQDVIEDKEGNLWFATWNYLIKFDGSNWHQFDTNVDFTNKYIEALYEDSKGRIWIGGRSILSYYFNDEFTHYKANLDFYDTKVRSIVEDENGQIIAIGDNSIHTFNETLWNRTYQSTDWIRHGLLDFSGQIWLSTFREGIVKYQPEDEYSANSVKYNTTQDLASNVVNSTCRTHDGNIVICTNLGITIIEPDIVIDDIIITPSALDNSKFSVSIKTSGICSPYKYTINSSEYRSSELPTDNISPGMYTLKVSNSYTSTEREITIGAQTSINETSNKPLIYPNPFVDKIILENVSNSSIVIYSLSGQRIWSSSKRNNSIIDLSAYPNGYYILQLTKEDETTFFKLLKE
ncbi:two-component regulator propeller domain-containing protein [Carboxylicivirga sp. M1479]|uniref:two-component regulator propeller domain-containing protein n=1 Tax=Carboxylicivirga sp. M1479 TaxID=2594476 RepID=UPI00163D7D22|nr:two-component regulator propeller domain-containing protein [Carboxylicivirga sp. M1479]